MAKVLEPFEITEIRKVLKTCEAFVLVCCKARSAKELDAPVQTLSSFRGDHLQMIQMLVDLLMREELLSPVTEALNLWANHTGHAIVHSSRLQEFLRQHGGDSTAGQLIGINGKPITHVPSNEENN